MTSDTETRKRWVIGHCWDSEKPLSSIEANCEASDEEITFLSLIFVSTWIEFKSINGLLLSIRQSVYQLLHIFIVGLYIW